MSDISNIKMVAAAALRQNTGKELPSKIETGNTLPNEAVAKNLFVDNVERAAVVDPDSHNKHLQEAVGSMNDFVQSVKRDLQFSVDQELNQTVIKVVDSASGKLIRQIPDDVFLKLARKVKESGELNLLNATG